MRASSRFATPATWPAVDSRRYETAQRAGQVIVGLVRQELRPSAIMTRAAFENAIRVNAAIGGSTNAVIHLLAIAGRLGVPLSLEDFDVLARDVPTLLNLQPSGKYLIVALLLWAALALWTAAAVVTARRLALTRAVLAAEAVLAGAQADQHLGAAPLAFPGQAQEQVLGAYVIVAEPESFTQ